jgi:hypothetical protein
MNQNDVAMVAFVIRVRELLAFVNKLGVLFCVNQVVVVVFVVGLVATRNPGSSFSEVGLTLRAGQCV